MNRGTIQGGWSCPDGLEAGSSLRSMMNTMTYEFDRLEQTVGMIKRHPYYPGKELVLDECLEDIDELTLWLAQNA